MGKEEKRHAAQEQSQEDRKLLIACCCYDSVLPETTSSLVRLLTDEVPGDIMPLTKSYAVHRSTDLSAGRNLVAELAVDVEATHLLTVDADMEFEPEDVWELMRAMQEDRQLAMVGSAYPRRDVAHMDTHSLHGMTYGRVDSDGQLAAAIPASGEKLVDVDIIGGGLALVNATVLAVLAPPWYKVGYQRGDVMPSFGVDTYLCQKLKHAGYRVQVHTGVTPSHIARGTLRYDPEKAATVH